MKATVIGNANKHIDDIASAQLDPFFYNRRKLEKHLGLTFHHEQAATLAEIRETIPRLGGSDIIYLRPSWREDVDQVLETTSLIRERWPEKTLVFIDPWDQTASRYFGVLPQVDWLLKYQRLKNVALYQRDYVGGSLITDYMARYLGYDLTDWDVSSTPAPGEEHKIITGWNFATARKYVNVLRNPLSLPALQRKNREIDVFCHLSLGHQHEANSWYSRYRRRTLKALKPLENSYRLATSGDYFGHRTVSSRQYQHEIRRSRIVVSPYGWGEITWRDYEAACHGCLLIKPSVEHVASSPNIFLAHKTYVPVRWDLEDLADTCAYYLAHPDEAREIAYNANQAYRDYFRKHRFVDKIAETIHTPSIDNSPTVRVKVPESLTEASTLSAGSR